MRYFHCLCTYLWSGEKTKHPSHLTDRDRHSFLRIAATLTRMPSMRMCTLTMDIVDDDDSNETFCSAAAGASTLKKKKKHVEGH